MRVPMVTGERAGSTTAATVRFAALPTLVVAALATTLLVEAMRVFVSYMVFVIDQSQRTTLALVTLGVFLAIGLAPLLPRLLGGQLALRTSVAGLVLARLLLQFWSLPAARMLLGAVVVIAWGWLLVALLGTDRRAVALGLPAGLALDLAIRIAGGSVDLPWMPGLGAHGVTLLLASLLLLGASLIPVPALDEPGLLATLPLIGLGPGLCLYHLLSGNLGLAQVRTDASLPLAASILAAGTALGLSLSWWGTLRAETGDCSWGRVGITLAATLLGVVGLWLVWQEGWTAALGLLLVSAATPVLLSSCIVGGSWLRPRAGVGGTTLWLTLGMLLHAVLLFAYYTATGSPTLIWVVAALFTGSALLATGLSWSTAAARDAALAPVNLLPAALAALALVAACGWQLATGSQPPAGPALDRDITVMTYNIQSGFAIDQRWDLEATARTIEAARPDVVVLQEVSRGWLVTSGVDQISWLSQRLGMPYVFGANSGDGLWGNAILTRAPITSVGHRRYSVTQNLRRAVIEVELATTAGPLWIYGTHLDDPRDADPVRQEQVSELLQFWDGRTPALLLGDFNDEPGTPLITRITSAGFTDLGATLGPEASTSADQRRIDYIFATDDLVPQQVVIPDSRASDHRPVVATVTLNP